MDTAAELRSERTFEATPHGIVTAMATTGDNLMEKVGEILQEVSKEAIGPRFEDLRGAEVRFKSPGEVVTVADEEAERQIGRAPIEGAAGVI